MKIFLILWIVSEILLFKVLFADESKKSSALIQKTKPNIIVILADDLGYHDLGCQGAKEIKTPFIDSIAAHGVRFTSGYVTAPQCAPSRVGLLSGCYQNRMGFESNEQAYTPGGPSLEYKIISERLKEVGYKTAIFGKWGVSSKKSMRPPQRGFDESFWVQDGNRYLPGSASLPGEEIQEQNDISKLDEYSTDAFGKRAVAFIENNQENPFFLYIPFITPHMPREAKKDDINRFNDIQDRERRITAAMIYSLDENVGRILKTLRKLKIEEKTLIFFLSDNGGYDLIASYGTPFRGTKTTLLEGGIRIPFLFQWKGVVPSGILYGNPIISLDIAMTAYRAAGMTINPTWNLEGVDLVPFLTQNNSKIPHESLFWRFNFPLKKCEEHSWAIRQGKWKLIKNGHGKETLSLYNLDEDITESNNQISQYPELVKKMIFDWEKWNSKNNPPNVLR